MPRRVGDFPEEAPYIGDTIASSRYVEAEPTAPIQPAGVPFVALHEILELVRNNLITDVDARRILQIRFFPDVDLTLAGNGG